ncbi:MAG: cytochrome-c peroxidase [Saprospiraceae bacterium]|nr:MAG: cytochrome-c peroxidase [Saprospiraceae bacterium]
MKIKTLPLISGAILLLSFTLTSCLKDEVDVKKIHYTGEEFAVLQNYLNLPGERESYQVTLPDHMRDMGMAVPQINDARATLGRVLFYDKQLSRNNAVSCASCHHQELAFSDDKAKSEGFDGELTLRNSLALASVANFESSYGGGDSFFGQRSFFFWDERAHTIAEQSTLTIQDDIEMGMDLDVLAAKLVDVPYYPILFQKAFGDEVITKDRVLQAVQEFVNSFVSTNSRFDKGMSVHRNAFSDFNNFSPAENLGKTLFISNCSSCHSSDMSRVVEAIANNGLDMEYDDPGVASITYNEWDEGKFKVPFLRNIALTAPYMHDGRFATLRDVVEHYNSGVKNHPNLDFRLKNTSGLNQPKRLNLNEEEKDALVAFLGTLTDNQFIDDRRFADPFK